MLTQHATVKSITDAPTLSPHKQQPASRTPHRESTTSNATRTQPHTATAETSRTLAWHIARRPGGLVALAIQYGHLRTAISGGYASRGRDGIDDLLDVETARATIETLTTLHEDLTSGAGISGPAARRAVHAATRAATFTGQIVTAKQARDLLANHTTSPSTTTPTPC